MTRSEGRPKSRPELILDNQAVMRPADGDISCLPTFDIYEEWRDERVRWNEERDLDFQPPARPRRLEFPLASTVEGSL
jgi:hypothetical protein